MWRQRLGMAVDRRAGAPVRGAAYRPVSRFNGEAEAEWPVGPHVCAAAHEPVALLGRRRGQMVAAVHRRRCSGEREARHSEPLVSTRLATSTAPRPDDGEWRHTMPWLEHGGEHRACAPAAGHNRKRRRSDSRQPKANQLDSRSCSCCRSPTSCPSCSVGAAFGTRCSPSGPTASLPEEQPYSKSSSSTLPIISECSAGDMAFEVAEGSRCLTIAGARTDASCICTPPRLRVAQMWHNGGGLEGEDLCTQR
ncbi:unnamed protein product [Urochloa humidicola]